MTRCLSTLVLCALVACGDDADPADASLDALVIDADRDAEFDAGFDTGSDALVDAPIDVPVDTGSDGAMDLPTSLLATGLYGPDGVALAEGVRPYDVRYPLWTDGLEKRRWIWLPPGTAIDTDDASHWRFPVGTRLWKEFALDGVRLETRLFEKLDAVVWASVAYVWREDDSDADAAPEGVVDVAGTFHDVPDALKCFGCHRGSGDQVLGVSAFQLARADFDQFVVDGLLGADPPYEEPPGTDVERDALGALHGNCGHCHSDLHPVAMVRTLRLQLQVRDPLEETGFFRTAVGATAAHELDGTRFIVFAGDPSASQLWLRPGRRDEWQMPPFGSEVVDESFRETVATLIESLTP